MLNVPSFKDATNTSGRLSPSISVIVFIAGKFPVGRLSLKVREIAPGVDVFFITEILLVLVLLASTSGFASPSRSAIEIPAGLGSPTKSERENDEAEIGPVPTFLRTEKLPAL